MKELQPKPDNEHQQREISGKLIFDKNGDSIGVAVNDGSLDYATQANKENIVVIIRPPKKGK